MPERGNLISNAVPLSEDMPHLNISEAPQEGPDIRANQIELTRAHPGAEDRVDNVEIITLFFFVEVKVKKKKNPLGITRGGEN